VVADVVFFAAPDDETAALTRLKGPGPSFASVLSEGWFYPDEAVIEWEGYFSSPEADRPGLPRYAAAILNDGCGVFAVSGKLTRALAEADVDTLRRLATSWAERLIEDGEDMTVGHAVALLQGLARLATTVPGEAGSLYCWHM
jgi:hypothetical protein